ncbi:MAG: hypothetical protein EZS28_034325 [Streblomastix strix]|uniref:Uncharacterized protein n=1 Tax=Streblomastix strix TaxID=222440 RepID=A0A5J4UHX3_9EUKA|nr:MAG: hypothetical protein EZS28_034325 [Streblomastix strix]
MSEIKHKELTDEDKIRLQLIVDAISRIKTMPQIGLERSETECLSSAKRFTSANEVGETIDDTSKAGGINASIYDAALKSTSKAKENPTQIGNEIIQIIRGVKTFLSPIIAGQIIKQGGTSNQILLANGDTIEKDQLNYEPIENARYSSIAQGMYETRCESGYTLFSIIDNAIKPKFIGTRAYPDPTKGIYYSNDALLV